MDSEEKRFLESVKEDISESTEDSDSKAEYFIIGMTFAVIAVSIFMFGLVSSKNSKLSYLDSKIQEEVTVPLNNLKKEREQVTSVSKQIDTLQTALSARVQHDKLVSNLASRTYKETSWKSFDYDSTSSLVRISAVADDFSAVAKSISSWRGLGSVSDVVLKSTRINSEEEYIEYSSEFEVDQINYSLSVKDATGGVKK